MSLKHGLLGFLNYGSMTGYELAKAFDESISLLWKAQTSQIYRELNAMEKMGWLISSMEIQTDKPNKRIYSITESGKEELLNWLRQDDTADMLFVRSSFIMRLFFSSENGTQTNIELLQKFKLNIQKALEQMAHTDTSIDYYKEQVASKENVLYWGMTAEFGKAYFQMCYEWAESCISKLEGIE